ncbi:MAG: hypothetical protein IJJ22_06265 [Oscillospiraceae bacterium]|nr:hypothetical protein [Oscillospiraceae bacterium]
MKKLRSIIAVMLVLSLAFALCACGGPKGPTEEDAEKYVKAVMDLMFTGDYDHSVKLADADDIEGTIESAVDDIVETILSDMVLSDDVIEDFKAVFMTMFSKVRYSVGTATKVEEGYDVPITIEPIILGDTLDKAVEDSLAEIMNDPEAANMTQDEMINKLMRLAVDQLKADVENPRYGESTVVTVRYKELQEGLYGVDEADGEKIGMALIQSQ